jgi:hypothetical protein
MRIGLVMNLLLLLLILYLVPNKAVAQTTNQSTQKKAAPTHWTPSGKDVLDFVESALKDSKLDRSVIEQVLGDIASGKAIFEPANKANDEKQAANFPCIMMRCRSLPCALRLGGGRYRCSNCCRTAASKKSGASSSENLCIESSRASDLPLKAAKLNLPTR